MCHGSTTYSYRGNLTSQGTDQQLQRIKAKVLAGKALGFIIHEDRMSRFQNRMCVLAMGELNKKIRDTTAQTLYILGRQAI